MDASYHIVRSHTTAEIRHSVAYLLEQYNELLPRRKDSIIFIKPNCNSDMCGLTGNTTDFRVLVALVIALKKLEYSKIVVGDGTSSGFINARIDVLSRLRLRALSEVLGFMVIDINKAPADEVQVGNQRVKIAQICLKSDFFINVPKLKTHAEAGMSAALKNMIGCVVGLEKQKIHKDLHRNIWLLNTVLKPDLHLIDGIVAMEGSGPSRGIPKSLGILLAGRDAALLDRICARLAGIPLDEVPYLQFASRQEGEEVEDDIAPWSKSFVRPKPRFLEGLINHPRYRPFFAKFRYMPGVYSFLSSGYVAGLLFALGARQDMFEKKDCKISNISVTATCNFCRKCEPYCPMALSLPEDIGDTEKGCIHCLYCFFVCPVHAVKIEGDIGFLKYQIDHYRDNISKLL